MTIPSTGAVSLNDVAAVTKATTGVRIEMNETLTRQLLGRPTNLSTISLADARGKPVATGPQTWTHNNPYNNAAPGAVTYNYVTPVYQYLVADVRAGGGGGGGQAWLCYGSGGNGANGTNSVFNNITATYGVGGLGEINVTVVFLLNCYTYSGAVSANGSGSGPVGSVVTSGGGGTGGAGAGGGRKGGNGGRVVTTYRFASTSGYPVWGTTYTLSVGRGGIYGAGYGGVGVNGSWGNPGQITINTY